MCTLLCCVFGDSVISVCERSKETFRNRIWSLFFCFSHLSFLAVVVDVILCCDPVLCFCGVLRFWVWGGLGGGNGKFRNCNIILGRSLFFFLVFDLKLLIDSPLSFFQFFVVSLYWAVCNFLLPPHGLVLETCSWSRSVEKIDDKELLTPNQLLSALGQKSPNPERR